MNRVKVIFNPYSNRGQSGHVAGDYQALANELGESSWVNTEYPGHAVELAAQAAREGYERVVAVGGDGTICETINGLMQVDAAQRPSLAVVPIGSGNDFIKGAHTWKNPHEAMRWAFSPDSARPIDVARVRLAGGRVRYLANVLGIGFDAAVLLQSLRIKRLRGFGMYFVAAVRTIIENFEAPHMDLEIDGQKISQAVQMLTIGNGAHEGGGFNTTPASQVDDGVLDYALVSPVSRLMMVRLIPEVMHGTHGRFKQVKLGTLRTLRLWADRPLLVHADGEVVATAETNLRELEVEVVPGAIRLVR